MGGHRPPIGSFDWRFRRVVELAIERSKPRRTPVSVGERHLARLAPILAAGATEGDMGWLSHMRFRGNRFVGYRIVGDAFSCSKKSWEQWDRVKQLQWLRDLRLRDCMEIFSMSTT
ncbi:MAG: hypothetical protein OXG24_03995 [Gammaproteobacteria bacterium]|nr:hypothetical protein [Gammaproteobacteria bacterium]